MIAEMALVAGCGMERWTSGDGPDVVVGAIGYGIISALARRRRNHRLEKRVRSKQLSSILILVTDQA